MRTRPKPRSAAEFARIYGPADYRAWGYRQPCVVVGCETVEPRPEGRVIEACHTTNGGRSRKADWEGQTYFGCWKHHDEAGNDGVDTFASRHRLEVCGVRVRSLTQAGLVTLAKFKEYRDGLAF